MILACGTAYHAGQVGSYLIEEWAGVPCDAEVASEWRYRRPLIEEGTLVVGISQSGETADTLAGLRLARQCGAPTLAITNSPGSQITREVDAVLYTHAGIEVGVAATKTFTSQLALMFLFALRLAELREALGDVEREALMAELRSLPHKIISTLERQGDVVDIAERHHDKPFFFYLGRHVGLPVCLEGALKLKEISYIPTEAYAAGEMKHGPIALLDDQTPVVCVATDSHVAGKLASNLQEVRARGAQVIAVATDGRRRDRRCRRRRPLGPAHEPAAAARAGGDPAPAPRLPHRAAARSRRRPAAQPRQDGDRRMTVWKSLLVCVLLASVTLTWASLRVPRRIGASSPGRATRGRYVSPSGRTPARTPGVTRPPTRASAPTASCAWASPRGPRGDRWSSPPSAGSDTAAIAGWSTPI